MRTHATRTRADTTPPHSQIHFLLLFSRQGKVRLSKYYNTFNQKERNKVRVAHAPFVTRTAPRHAPPVVCTRGDKRWRRRTARLRRPQRTSRGVHYACSAPRYVRRELHRSVTVTLNMCPVRVRAPPVPHAALQIIKEATTQVLIRGNKLCNFVARARAPNSHVSCRARTPAP
jgi:hypothetical protein